MDNSEMMKAELMKGPTPKRKPLAIVGAALGVVVLVAGGVVGVNAATDYRAEITALQASAQDDLDAATEQRELADAAAERAAEAATAAGEATTSLAAAEAEALAQAEAKAAEEAAAANSNSGSGSDSVHGKKVPWIPSSDPQNAAGGDWDMSVCKGGSASTGSDGTPYCD